MDIQYSYQMKKGVIPIYVKSEASNNISKTTNISSINIHQIKHMMKMYINLRKSMILNQVEIRAQS